MRITMDPMVAAAAEYLQIGARVPGEHGTMLAPLLREVQARLGEVPVRLLPDIARAAGVAESRAYAVATFYPAFRLSGAGGNTHAPTAEGQIAQAVGVPLDAPQLDGFGPPHPSETRRVLARCGHIDPYRIEDYCADGGYAGLAQARSMPPEAVIEMVSSAGLRGRGGAGFPVARKWLAARETEASARVVVCNAAEGDLGASMDRAILQTDPHAVLEGMAIAAHASGASEGYLFLRNEYSALIPLLRHAIGQAGDRGFLGGGFQVQVVRAAGRYVCGEETALLNAIEGKPGRPRSRPPFPSQSGLYGKPTVINNVKTLVAAPLILRHGAEWFASVGTPRSRGTAVLSLEGCIARSGLVEVAMGTPLRRVIEDIGGGAPGGRSIKAVQTGGPLGGLVPAHLLDTPITYEDMAAIGSPLGSGGMIVIDDATCAVAVARGFAAFCAEESCGYCTPCRLGTARLARLSAEIAAGRGTPAMLEQIEDTIHAMAPGSFCAFGHAAPGVLASAIRHFRAEFEAHIGAGRCALGTCDRLTHTMSEDA